MCINSRGRRYDHKILSVVVGQRRVVVKVKVGVEEGKSAV